MLTNRRRWPLRASEIALGAPTLIRDVIEHDGFAAACGWADPWPFAGASATQATCALGLAAAVIALADHGALSLRFECDDGLQAALVGAADPPSRTACGVVERSILETAGEWRPVAALFPSVTPSEWRSGAWHDRWHPRREQARDDLREAIPLCVLVLELADAPATGTVTADDVLRALLDEGVSFAKRKGVP
jgi:hypothetical protein